MADSLQLPPNIPVQVTFKYPEPKGPYPSKFQRDDGSPGPPYYFTTVDTENGEAQWSFGDDVLGAIQWVLGTTDLRGRAVVVTRVQMDPKSRGRIKISDGGETEIFADQMHQTQQKAPGRPVEATQQRSAKEPASGAKVVPVAQERALMRLAVDIAEEVLCGRPTVVYTQDNINSWAISLKIGWDRAGYVAPQDEQPPPREGAGDLPF